jgi:hypothetical protein
MTLWGDIVRLGTMGVDQPWLAVLLPALLAVFLLLVCWLSYQRLGHSNKTRLALVWGLNLCAFVGLSGLISDVQIASKGSLSAQLLTSGATNIAQSESDDGQDVFVMADWALDHPADPLPERAKVIQNIAQLATLSPDLEHLQVHGDGLSASQWHTFFAISPAAKKQKLRVSFYPSARQFGLIDMSWQKQLAPGEYAQITGTLQGAAENPAPQGSATDYLLSLIDPRQQVVEQHKISTEGAFQLKFPALRPGRWIYRLQVSDGISRQILVDEPIAINVTLQHPARLLIKQSAPSFETRQLKNWASGFGSKVTIVSQISQNNSIVQQLNAPGEPGEKNRLDPFLNASLHEYDFLVMDARALSTLPSDQLEYLYTAIFRGLGLLIIADGTSLADRKPQHWLSNIKVMPLEGARGHYQTLANWPNSKLSKNIEIPALKLIAPAAEVLVQDGDSQPLLVANNIGLGKVAVGLINNSYQWQISGHSNDYSHYWQTLIKQLGRSNRTNAWIAPSNTQLFYTAQKNSLCAMSSGNSMYLQIDAVTRLTADVFQPSMLCTPYWTEKAGWQSFNLLSEISTATVDTTDTYEVVDKQMNYVYQANDWQSWQQANKHKASKEMAGISPALAPTRHFKALNKMYFWWLLFIASSLLWIERKFYQGHSQHNV